MAARPQARVRPLRFDRAWRLAVPKSAASRAGVVSPRLLARVSPRGRRAGSCLSTHTTVGWAAPGSVANQRRGGAAGLPLLWVRARLRAVVVQLLLAPRIAENSLQTAFAASSLTVAAVLGFSRQYRAASFIQRCLFKHVRRYLLALGSLQLGLRLYGGIPKLRSYWRALTRPAAEFYRHPLTDELVADIEVTPADAKKHGSAHAAVRFLATEFDLTDGDTSPAMATSAEAFYCEQRRALLRTLKTQAAWARYRLV